MEKIRKTLLTKQQENELPYDLRVSIGFDELLNDRDTVYKCVDRADKKLYIDKSISR